MDDASSRMTCRELNNFLAVNLQNYPLHNFVIAVIPQSY